MKEWVSVQDLAAATGISKRAAQKAAVTKGWPCQEVNRNGRGRPIKEFRLSCLPEEYQEKITKHWLKQRLERADIQIAPESRSFEGDRSTANPMEMPRPAVQPIQPVAAKRTIVPARSDEIGLMRFNLVHAWRELVETQPHGKKVEAMAAFLTAYRCGGILPRVLAKIGDVSERSLRDLDKRLRESRAANNGNEDYRVLCDGRGGWRKHGTTLWRERSISNEAKDVFLGCWLRPEQPTVSLAIRAARMMLERRGIVEESDDRTWRRWLEDWSKRSQHIIVLAREGEKAYRDRVGPYITRDDSMLDPGQVLIADGHDLNFEVLHPYTGRPARLKLVMFFDWASRMPAGWQIMPTENTVVIHAALRNALINLGKLPQVVYLDNGRAFKSKVFCETDPDLTELNGLYARLGIATQFSQPYNARAKIIERFFETLNEQFERLMASYTGASIGDKPAWRARNEKFHQAQHAKRTGGWIPDIREAAWLIDLYIKWYGQQEHSGIHWQKPAEVLAGGKGPGLNLAELNDQFLWTKKVSPRRCRVVLFNIDYESDCLHGYGDDVLVKYDCSDLSKVWIHTLAGEYLGEGAPVQALNPIAKQLGDQVGVDQVKAEIERQRRLAKQTKENLIALGATTEQVDGLSALPWRQKAAVLPGGKDERKEAAAPEAEIDQAERTRLELVVSNAEARAREEERDSIRLERPANFVSPAARYDWCWRAKFEHKGELSGEEAAFMGWFETTAEYNEYRQRYEDLRLIYGGEIDG
jgi:putative transposase